MFDVTHNVPERLKEVFSNFYSSLQDDLQKINDAVKNASQTQDTADSTSS